MLRVGDKVRWYSWDVTAQYMIVTAIDGDIINGMVTNLDGSSYQATGYVYPDKIGPDGWIILNRNATNMKETKGIKYIGGR